MTGIRRCITSAATVQRGALVAVVGPNGAGKSTLFKGIVGVLKPLAGSIERNGDLTPRHRLSAAGRRDRPQLSDQRLRHGGDGPVARAGLFGGIGAKASATTSSTRSQPSASPVSNSAPSVTLSGGQMQRVLFARLLLQDARLIVLDEPFNAIDTQDVGRSARPDRALARAKSAP